MDMEDSRQQLSNAQDARGTDYHAQDARGTGYHAQDAHGTHGASGICKRQGAYLPHWTAKGAIYHVRFSLHDSLPRIVRERLLEEREEILSIVGQPGCRLTDYQKKRLLNLYSEKIDRYLDAGHGSCLLKRKPVAELVAGALKHFDGERYRLFAWCVMPNHVHTVVQPLSNCKLSSILHSWKSFTALKANRMLGRTGAFWKSESFDHLIRNERDFNHWFEYVYDNPLKAGLSWWEWRGRLE